MDVCLITPSLVDNVTSLRFDQSYHRQSNHAPFSLGIECASLAHQWDTVELKERASALGDHAVLHDQLKSACIADVRLSLLMYRLKCFRTPSRSGLFPLIQEISRSEAFWCASHCTMLLPVVSRHSQRTYRVGPTIDSQLLCAVAIVERYGRLLTGQAILPEVVVVLTIDQATGILNNTSKSYLGQRITR